MLMPILMMLALSLMLLLDAFEDVANAVNDETNADANGLGKAAMLRIIWYSLPPFVRRKMMSGREGNKEIGKRGGKL